MRLRRNLRAVLKMGLGLLALMAGVYTVMRHNLSSGHPTQPNKREVPPLPPPQQPAAPPASGREVPAHPRDSLDNHGRVHKTQLTL